MNYSIQEQEAVVIRQLARVARAKAELAIEEAELLIERARLGRLKEETMIKVMRQGAVES